MNKSRSELPAPLSASVLGDGTERYDVVVIGFGIAGGSAALEAARAGVRVLLLERAAVHGGTTCMAGGHFYLGGGTAVQATGHEDSAEKMYKYLVAVSKEPEHDKIRAYCEGSVEHFGWLESLGFEFERSYFPGKGYGSGTQLGEGSFFGRRAGRHAAQLLPASQPARNRDPWGR